MQRCLVLAKNGLGKTYPNPMVGSVIVHDDKIIGEGWHQKAGEPHAEVNAINSVKDKSLLPKSTIYVNLEPCSHYGKTPPCANLIVEMGIKNVVIGSIDYNSEVHGKGILHLQKNGCNVVVGVLEKECVELNKRFFTFHQKKRPYVILKWAETNDGFIFPKAKKKEEETIKELKPIWISNAYSQQLVHKWRTEEQAILVGTNTVLQDNPRLNARDFEGKSPIRILIDRELKISTEFNLLDESGKTFVFTEKRNAIDKKNTFFHQIDFNKSIVPQICSVLYREKIQSIIVEGGTKTLQSFIDENIWDEARIFTGNISFENGLPAPKIAGKTVQEKHILDDKLTILRND
jgi:diaminohydroxyphosphoribosylaminopyrimidine deaminase/5-amino-6-(5-phosphoribosylamino)uracil reductase